MGYPRERTKETLLSDPVLQTQMSQFGMLMGVESLLESKGCIICWESHHGMSYKVYVCEES